MGANQSKLGDLYYTKTKKCIDPIVITAGKKFYIVTSHKIPHNPKFMALTYSIKDIGYACGWKLKLDKQLYIVEVELTKDINIVELRSPSDITKLHECTGIDFKLESSLWNNYYTLDALKDHPIYEGWIEYPTAEPGHILGIEIAITNPSLVMLTGKSWTLEDILIHNADEFECIDMELVADIKQGKSNAIEFAKQMINDVTKILNEF